MGAGQYQDIFEIVGQVLLGRWIVFEKCFTVKCLLSRSAYEIIRDFLVRVGAFQGFEARADWVQAGVVVMLLVLLGIRY